MNVTLRREVNGRSLLKKSFVVWLTLLVVAGFSPAVLAQQPKAQTRPSAIADNETDNEEPEAKKEAPAPGAVSIEARYVLTVYQPIGDYTPKERAERIAERIIAVAKDGDISQETVKLQSRDAWTEITAGGRILMAVTDVDAKMAGKPREQLAAEDAESIRQALLNYRREHSWSAILRGTVYSTLATILLVPIAWMARKVRLSLRNRIEKWIALRTQVERKTPWYISVTYGVSLILALGTVIRWLLVIAIVEAYVTIILGFFSFTRNISHAMTDWLFATLGLLATSVLAYLPNLLVIALIGAVASQVLRLITMVFEEIGKGNLSMDGFYPDWARPTAKLIRMLVVLLVVVVVFPYLPGSKSPAFQGISIFAGVLLSLGSSSAVANAIAGIILTYMRSFLVGDWVKIGDTIGEVVERNMLVTRILTPKQEIITIPNATVMGGSVMNYTREAKNAGVIFHTLVTIGYDAPWKTVHQLLIGAAVATEHVLRHPEPFVLQTALNDFYVSYELNAYTDTPRQMQFIYSQLHQNIQDLFNEAGVEICSPHFSSLRDGNTVAIPQQYIPQDYKAPSFNVVGNSGKQGAEAVANRSH